MYSMSRRNFLRSAASALAAACVPRARAAARPQRVAVVGAGMAGLVAAYELMRAGHTVSLHEARERCGGRIRTRRNAFGDGLYVEEGAIDFGDGYTLIEQYLTQFAIPRAAPAPSAKAAEAEVYYVSGKRYLSAAGREPDWPYALSPSERRLGRRGLWEKYGHPAEAVLDEPFGSHSLSRAARALDARSVAELARRAGASDAAVLLMRQNFLGADYEHVSALEDLLWQRFLDRSRTWSRLEGGNERLPQAFAERLGPRVFYGAQLRAFSQERDGVRLTFSHGGAQQQVNAERAVIAIPFSVLRGVEFGDALARHKRTVVEKLRYESVTCVQLHARHRFWHQAGLKGQASTDLPIGTVLDASAGQHGEAGILVTQATGGASRRLAALTPAERLSFALENVGRVYPGMGEAYAGGSSVCWDQEPFALGGWAYYAPGEMNSLFPHVAVPDGRIHFAGEHTASTAFAEGAAQSGLRVAQEINAT